MTLVSFKFHLRELQDREKQSNLCIDDDVIKWKHFRVTGPLCGEVTGHRRIRLTKPMMRSFDVFFDLRLNKRLWRQCNVDVKEWDVIYSQTSKAF